MSELAVELRPTPDPVALLRAATGSALAAEEEIRREREQEEADRGAEG